MLATFAIEMFGALYLLWKYRLDGAARLVIAILVCLAIFQLAEWNICEGLLSLTPIIWAKIGYIAITMLPPLGLHLATVIAKETNRVIQTMPYFLAGGFIGLFLFYTQGISGSVCLGNYVIFAIEPRLTAGYTLYYYGLLAVGSAYAFSHARKKRLSYTRKKALLWLGIGYMAFIVPTTAVVQLKPETLHGVPSIMCGFAVLLALALLFRVAPNILERRTTS